MYRQTGLYHPPCTHILELALLPTGVDPEGEGRRVCICDRSNRGVWEAVIFFVL